MQVFFEQVATKEEESAVIKAVEKTADIVSAIEMLEGGSGTVFVIKDGARYLCKISSIYYIESVDKRTYVYTKDGCYESKSRLYELEEVLGSYFARCSKAMIVNLRKLKKVESEFGGRMVAELLNSERIVISRSYVKDIKRRLEG